jgi:hypothetical protein
MKTLWALLFVPLVACATISTGNHEKINVSTSPSEVLATLVCDGHPQGEGLTPIVFTIRRDAGDCTLTLRKEGFEEQTHALEQGINPAYWGNMIFSPLAPAGAYVTILGDSGEKVIGVSALGAALLIFGTDFHTGAVHAHKPASVDAVLKKR